MNCGSASRYNDVPSSLYVIKKVIINIVASNVYSPPPSLIVIHVCATYWLIKGVINQLKSNFYSNSTPPPCKKILKYPIRLC